MVVDESTIREAFPQLGKIGDDNLREFVVRVWVEAARRGEWESLEGIPFTLLINPAPYDLLEHTRRVTEMAAAVGERRNDVDLDLLIAGALLHDVGKLLEYEKSDGGVVVSKCGKLLRHPISGAALILEMGGSEELAHIVAAHSREGDLLKGGRSPEATIVFHSDFIDFEIAKRNRG
ncbi:MAG: HD domain-containing protein [Thermoplasmata archaeon]|nr:HD domain-containing protein [Thermoplasmata archaeon]